MIPRESEGARERETSFSIGPVGQVGQGRALQSPINACASPTVPSHGLHDTIIPGSLFPFLHSFSLLHI